MKKLALALVLVMAAAAALHLINPPYKAFKISSRILGEKRTILEYLPAGGHIPERSLEEGLQFVFSKNAIKEVP